MLLAQLFKVPSTWVPCGLAAVRIIGWPAAGPDSDMGVLAVMRRAHFEGRTICQPLGPSFTSITEMPWAFCAFSTFSAVIGSKPSGNSKPSSTYSWLLTSKPWVELPCNGKNTKPSWCMPICTACSCAVLLASGL